MTSLIATSPNKAARKRCAALICTAGCPPDVTEQLADALPDVCFDCYTSEVSQAQELCPYRDIYLLISAEDIIGVENEWLSASSALTGISLKERNIFICTYQNNMLSPDWNALLLSLSSRGANPTLINSHRS